MVTYILRRLLYGSMVVVVSSFLIFVFVSTTTDPLETANLNPRISRTTLEKVTHDNHLDQPVIVRYEYWVRTVVRGGFGNTIVTERPIWPDIKRVFGHTLQLVIAAEVLALLLATALGVYSAVRQYSPSTTRQRL